MLAAVGAQPPLSLILPQGVSVRDRLEDKAVEPIEQRDDDRRDVKDFTDAELTAIIRSHVKIVPVEATDEERPEGESLN
jgi:hypothetical protein